MQVIACVFRSEQGECLLKNQPCNGCQDLPFFINWEEDDD